MPLYEYECESCGSRFERIQKFSDPPPDACPTCGGGVRKLLSSPAIQFKGSGWYITDYARKAGGDGGAAKDGKESKESKEAPKKDASAASTESSSASTSPSSTPSSTPKSD